jgi:CO dehydrogenase/acetyl-CoA synthase gamma subunit (corrinoid Fe-S protein)
MDKADLYFEQISLDRYITEQECQKCGVDSCKKLVEQLNSGKMTVSELHPLPKQKVQALQFAINSEQMLPEVPKLTFPRPIDPEVVELNQPKDGDPIVITGNNQYTQEVLLTVLSTITHPLFVFFSDTRGDTLDMAVVYESFNPEAIKRSFNTTGLNNRIKNSPVIIPGKAAELNELIQKKLGLKVETGPVCAAELPLYFNHR